jgi:hypothetical protein
MALSVCQYDGGENVDIGKVDVEMYNLCKIWFQSVRAWEVAKESQDDARFSIPCFVVN